MKNIIGYDNYLISEKGEIFSTSGHKKPLMVKEGCVSMFCEGNRRWVSVRKLIDANLKGMKVNYFIPKQKPNEFRNVKSKINDLQLEFDQSDIIERVNLLPRLNALKHKLKAMEDLKNKDKKFWNHFQYKFNTQQK